MVVEKMKPFEKDKGKIELLESSCYGIGAGILMVSAGISLGIIPAVKWGGYVFTAGVMGMCGYYMGRSELDKTFENCGLKFDRAYPVLKEKKKTDVSTIYKYSLPDGLSVDDFIKKQQAIENKLGKKVEIRYTFKAIEIEAFDNDVENVIKYDREKLLYGTKVQIGYTSTGILKMLDISEAPHLLIAGATGSGKSTLLRAIIVGLISKKDVGLHLIDLKNGAELQYFENCMNVLSFSRTINEAEVILCKICDEVQKRYDMFYANKVKDIEAYNKKINGKKMKRHVIIIDEFADMQNSKEGIEKVDTIAQKARAAGIHLVLCTQRPDSKIISGNIKNNIPTIIGLKTANRVSSSVIFDEPGLEMLRGKGDLKMKHNSNIYRLQAPFLSVEEAEEIIAPYKKVIDGEVISVKMDETPNGIGRRVKI